MRWKTKCEPNIGDEVIVNKFLIFPKRIDEEYRWLEKVSYKRRYGMTYPDGQTQWLDLEWI